MKYYKLVLDNTIIGAVTSYDFIRYSPIAQCYLSADETTGEYVGFGGKLYRSTWMSPIVQLKEYTSVLIIEIEEQEYLVYKEAMEKNEVIADDTKEEEPVYIDPIDTASIDFIRSSKLTEMSYACRQAIEAGFDLTLRGETYHFSLSTQDLLNLMNLSSMAQTQELIPYHADGKLYTFYTATEINEILVAANNHKIYHTAYYNSLKEYINALETIEEIAAITYGISIPDEYKSDVLKVLE